MAFIAISLKYLIAINLLLECNILGVIVRISVVIRALSSSLLIGKESWKTVQLPVFEKIPRIKIRAFWRLAFWDEELCHEFPTDQLMVVNIYFSHKKNTDRQMPMKKGNDSTPYCYNMNSLAFSLSWGNSQFCNISI